MMDFVGAVHRQQSADEPGSACRPDRERAEAVGSASDYERADRFQPRGGKVISESMVARVLDPERVPAKPAVMAETSVNRVLEQGPHHHARQRGRTGDHAGPPSGAVTTRPFASIGAESSTVAGDLCIDEVAIQTPQRAVAGGGLATRGANRLSISKFTDTNQRRMGRPRQITDEQILDTTRTCVLEHGAQVSLDVVAERLGVTAPALLKRFGCRQELMVNALRPPAPPPVV